MTQRHFSQAIKCLAIISIFLSVISFINIRYIYAGADLSAEAESYRLKGYEAQEKGDIDGAMSWYQKAVALDPRYAAPHNDLGILFEAKGWLDRAESEYQKALALDPNYEKAHTNLALLYERKGELEKAAFHWMRRYKLGAPNDPWTYEARQRLEKIGLIDKTEEGVFLPRSGAVAGKPGLAPAFPPTVQEQEVEGWTRLGQKKAIEGEEEIEETPEKKIEKRPIRKKVRPEPKKTEKKPEAVKKEPREKKAKAAKKVKETKKKPGSEWTRTSFGREKKAAATTPSGKIASLDKELQESLRLAEQRLKEERGKAKKEEQKSPPSVKPKQVVQQKTPPPAGAKTYYQKAKDYFNKGEYARALDAIREAKRDYPDDLDLLDLEQSIKDKMKEEKIQDHYNEGIMRYRQEDYPGARKEFEEILDVLPE